MFITKKKFKSVMLDLYVRLGFDSWLIDEDNGSITEHRDLQPISTKEFHALLNHLGLQRKYDGEGGIEFVKKVR